MPTVDIDGQRVDYADAGRGVPIVFLPGLVGSKEWFCYQVSGLSRRYRIISCSLRRGRGRNYSTELLVGDLKRFLERLKLGSVVVVGHEFGALVAATFAASMPQRCLALVLVSAAPSLAGLSSEEILSYTTPGVLKIDSFFARLRRRLFGGKPERQDDNDPLDYLARHNAGIDRATLTARVKLLRRCDLTPVLKQIVAPTLVVVGSRDAPRILAGSQLLDELIADSVLEVLEEADHFCFHTRYDLFNAVVEEYLSDRIASL